MARGTVEARSRLPSAAACRARGPGLRLAGAPWRGRRLARMGRCRRPRRARGGRASSPLRPCREGRRGSPARSRRTVRGALAAGSRRLAAARRGLSAAGACRPAEARPLHGSALCRGSRSPLRRSRRCRRFAARACSSMSSSPFRGPSRERTGRPRPSCSGASARRATPRCWRAARPVSGRRSAST